MRVLRLVATLGLTFSALAAVPAVSAAAPPPGGERGGPNVLHRVVWDQYQKRGTHLWSANPDGSDARKIYTRARGFVAQISLNRQGSEAAVAPVVLSGTRAALVVVDVLGRSAPRNLLVDHPEIYAVGGIGWSPNGRRLVFEGAVGEPSHGLTAHLFTVPRDGGAVQELCSLGPIEDRSAIGLHTSLAWTPAGIFHYDQHGLHRFRAGRDPVVLRAVIGEAVSGDGQWLYIERRHGPEYAMWRMYPDGSRLARLYALNYPGFGYVSAPDEGYTYYWHPSYDGAQMLSQLDGTDGALVLVHEATRGPLETDPVLPFSSIGSITWN